MHKLKALIDAKENAQLQTSHKCFPISIICALYNHEVKGGHKKQMHFWSQRALSIIDADR